MPAKGGLCDARMTRPNWTRSATPPKRAGLSLSKAIALLGAENVRCVLE